jgi:hypothetical protein
MDKEEFYSNVDEALEKAHLYFLKRDSNPLYVWSTIKMCLQKGRHFPDWVSCYLDDVAEQLLKVTETQKEGQQRVMKILRLDGRHFAEFHRAERNLKIFDLVKENIATEKNKRGSTVRSIEKARGAEGLDVESIRKIYYEIKRVVDAIQNDINDLDELESKLETK